MIDLLIFAAVVAFMVPLYVIAQHTRYGHLRISELPGFVWVMLGGPEYRRAAAAILASRALRTDSVPLPPRPRHPRWVFGYCSMEHSQPERKCAKCDKQWDAHR